jgi:DNA-directed RNA polymerase subunit beta
LRGLQSVVSVGQRVEAVDLLADGITSRGGVLSLGRTTKVLASPRVARVSASSSLLRELTSRHLLTLECVVADSKQGAEYLQREIPEVDAAHSEHLDEDGVIRLGSIVSAGDVLVGKYTPTASGRANSSLYVAEGQHGKVIQVDTFFRKGTEQGSRRELVKREEMRQQLSRQCASLRQAYHNIIIELITGATSSSKIVDAQGQLILPQDTVLTEEILRSLTNHLWELSLTDEDLQEKLSRLQQRLEDEVHDREQRARPAWLYNELPPGIIATIKITIEQERALTIGDTLTAPDGRSWCIETIFDDNKSELRTPGESDSEERLYLIKSERGDC